VLLESDVALTLHYDTLETRLAFRSRVLDYIWAGLPIVATYGDAISELVAEYGIGIMVDYKDVNGVAAAILQLLETPHEDFEERFEKARQELTWERAARPLVEFCRHPRRAPDRVAMGKRLGNPYYFEERRQLLEERDYWRDLVRRYEQGRFMRGCIK
jgi:glycosyltransferase involved in cell wall biosynthesis